MAVEAYRQKRNFKDTSEPKGGKSLENKSIFVVQKHQASHLHYDFRLELSGKLKSWAVPKGPSMNPERRRLASLVEDHPFDYKDFEGKVPEGNYGAGTVIICDKGTYEPLQKTGIKTVDEKMLKQQFYSGKMSFLLKGKKLKGAFTLIKAREKGVNAWLLIKLDDKYATTDDIILKNKSVVSGLTLEEMSKNNAAKEWQSNRSSTEKTQTIRDKAIAIDIKTETRLSSPIELIKRNLHGKPAAIPTNIEPMYATLIKAPFTHEDWEFEIKWDGYRCLAYINDGNVSLRSRSNQHYKLYSELISELKQWGVNALLDGEIVVLDKDGRANFEKLQNWQNNPIGHLAYMVFDILWLDGIDLSREQLKKRKEILQKILPPSNVIQFSSGVDECGIDFFEAAKKFQLEGIIGKSKKSIYRHGKRTKDWVKLKISNRQEFVLGGWVESKNGRAFKSVLFGYYQHGQLQYFGHAGHGFTQKNMPHYFQLFKQLEINESPFENETDRTGNIHWIKPELVAEIDFATVTKSGKIRHPAVILGLRDDKNPRDVKLEIDLSGEKSLLENDNDKPSQSSSEKRTADESNWPMIENQAVTSSQTKTVKGKQVLIINPDKRLWGTEIDPIRKNDLLQYYHAVYKYMAPHLKDRPLSLHIKHIAPVAKGFYIKDMEGRQPEWAEVFSVPRKHKKKGKRDVIDYLLCNNEATLQYTIGLGAIDINPWTSRTMTPENPDFIIIDLDPSDEDFKKVIETAQAAKQLFDSEGVTAFPKTSGKTGLHLYLPCQGFSFLQARAIAETICTQVHELVPSITTTAVNINSRGDKLYLDPNQNDYTDTVAAPYSVRPTVQPTVSTPLKWKEINQNLDPADFTIHSIPGRLKTKGELFQDVLLPRYRKGNQQILSKFL
jgi:bifunctional non-homologous end joining protein LigD